MGSEMCIRDSHMPFAYPQEAELQQARSLAHSLQEELSSCKGKLQEQAGSHRKEMEGLQLSVAELEQKLQQSSAGESTEASHQAQRKQQNAMNMVCINFSTSRIWVVMVCVNLVLICMPDRYRSLMYAVGTGCCDGEIVGKPIFCGSQQGC